VNIFPNNNVNFGRPIAPQICDKDRDRDRNRDSDRRRNRLDNLEEGDPILVQTPSGICEQGVFLRIDNDFLIWARTISNSSFIAITSLDSISITRL